MNLNLYFHKAVLFKNELPKNVKSVQFKNSTLGTTVYAPGCGILYELYVHTNMNKKPFNLVNTKLTMNT